MEDTFHHGDEPPQPPPTAFVQYWRMIGFTGQNFETILELPKHVDHASELFQIVKDGIETPGCVRITMYDAIWDMEEGNEITLWERSQT